MILSESIDGYLAYRRLRRYADNTLKLDERALRQLLAVVGDLQVRNLTPVHIDKWLAVRSAICQPSSLNTEQQTLRSWEKWMHQRANLAPRQNLTGHLRNYRYMPKQKLIVPASHFADLLDAAIDPTDRAVVAMGLYLFPRQSEIASLRVSDFSLEMGTVWLTIHKTNERDLMPICSELDSEMRRYWTWRAGLCPLAPSQYALCAKRIDWNGLRTPRPLDKITRPFDAVQRVLTQAGYDVPPGEGCHTLRRSGATALYRSLKERGHDYAIRTVQAMLHHKSVTTTERYLDITADRKARDDLFRGKPMFEQPADNIISIRRGESEAEVRGA